MSATAGDLASDACLCLTLSQCRHAHFVRRLVASLPDVDVDVDVDTDSAAVTDVDTLAAAFHRRGLVDASLMSLKRSTCVEEWGLVSGRQFDALEVALADLQVLIFLDVFDIGFEFFN